MELTEYQLSRNLEERAMTASKSETKVIHELKQLLGTLWVPRCLKGMTPGLLDGPLDALASFLRTQAAMVSAMFKWRSQGKWFRDDCAVCPERYIYAKTAEEAWLVELILADKGYHVVCGGRQTGKSTLAQALLRSPCLKSQGITVLYMGFPRQCMHSASVQEFWDTLFQYMSMSRGDDRFKTWQTGQTLNNQPAQPNANTFVKLCNAEPPLCIVVDDAHCLSYAKRTVVNSFLQAVGQLKGNNNTPFRGIILVGNYSVLKLVNVFNRSQDIYELFKQLQQQYAARPVPIILSDDWIKQATNAAHLINNGNKGLVGVFGSVIDDAVAEAAEQGIEPISNRDTFIRDSLPKRIALDLQPYMSVMRDVYPYKKPATLSAAESQLHEQKALQGALLQGLVEVKRDEVPWGLLDESVLVPVDKHGQPIQDVAQLFLGEPGSNGGSIRLKVSAPLLTHSMLARLYVPCGLRAPPPKDMKLPKHLNIDGLLEAVVMNLHMDTLFAVEACDSNTGKPSHYAYQAQSIPIINAIIGLLKEHYEARYNYKVVTDARSFSMQGGDRQWLDILLMADQRLALGVKMLACDSYEDMVKSMHSAHQLCSKQLSELPPNQGHQMLVVNFIVSGNGDAVPDMYFPACSTYVGIRNVVIPRIGQGKQATIHAGPDHNKAVTLRRPHKSGSLKLMTADSWLKDLKGTDINIRQPVYRFVA